MDESVVYSLARKFGGRFHLTAMIQKRLIQLNRGAKPTVEWQETNLRTVIEELLQGHIQDEARDDISVMADDAPPADAATETEQPSTP